MSQPDLRVELALGATPFGTWAWDTGDVSSYVRQRLTIRRGRRSIFSDIEAGRATITLDNRSRLFDPENTSSIHHASLKPLVPIRIRAVYDGDLYPLFQGFVVDWRPRYEGGTTAYLDLTCVDAFEPLSRLFLGEQPPEGTPVEFTQAAIDQRIIDTLDAAGWPGTGHGPPTSINPRNIDNTSALQIQAATGDAALVSVPALEHLQAVARSVDGLFFIDAAGNATFQDRSYRDGLTSVGTFGDAADGSELPYKDVQTGFGVSQVFNRITWQNQALPGETRDIKVKEDPASQAQYLRRTLPHTSMLLASDSDAETIANQIKGRLKDPRVRAERIAPTLSPSTDASWPIVLGADISTRLDIRRRGLNGGSMLELTGFIEGTDLDIVQTPRGGTVWAPAWDISTI